MLRIFTSILLLGSTAAVAQTGTKRNTVNSADTLSEVLISTNAKKYTAGNTSESMRLATPILETPQNIQVVTQDMLKDQQVISMSDGLIRNVSGLVRMEHWGDMYTNITARGSQIQAFRNGFNVVNSYWGPLTEDMSFVERIEFVKGPAGFMLASGDPSGLYNVVTKKPTGINKGEASFTLGSFDLYRGTLDLDGKLSKNGRLLYRLNLAAQNKKSHRANEYNNRYVIAPVLSYQLDDRTKLTLEYNYQLADMSNVGSFYIFSPQNFAVYPVGFTTLPAGTENTRINDHGVYLNLQHEINDDWKITGQVSRFMYNQQGASMWPSVVNPDGTMIRNIGIWDAQSRMSMAQVFVNGEVTTGPVRHRILAGVDMANKSYIADWGQSHDLDSASAPFNPYAPNLGAPATGYPDFDRETPLRERAQASGGLQDQRYTALYVQDELGFFDDVLRLTLAGRFTSLSQFYYIPVPDKANHFTPRVGLSASIDKSTAVYALYDQAFIPQTGILANGGKVQPVTGNNMEVGVKKDWDGGRWNTTLSVYRILKNNELTADPFSAPTSGLSVEMGQKVSEGVEFDLRGTIVRGLNLTANYAYTNSRILKVSEGVTAFKAGDVVPGFARHTANLWLNYKVQRGLLSGFGISAGGTFLGGRETYWDPSPDPSKTIEDYLKIDGGLFWEGNKLRVAVNVFNVLNQYLYSGSYYAWLSAYNWQTEAPRNLRMTVSYRFQ
ncbi:MAG: TonB-dependent siderophore receptor [Flavipsychrobacter sp.]|nr:TonB-dependent siderophore receptor [Flavipsychrobacter sp.]